MAAITAKNVIEEVRRFLNDEVVGAQRWTDEAFFDWINKAVHQITKARSDSLVSLTGTLITITDVTATTDTISIDGEWLDAIVDMVVKRALQQQAGEKENRERSAIHAQEASGRMSI